MCRAASAQMRSRQCSKMGTSCGGVFAIAGFFRILGLVLELPNCLKEPMRSLVRLPS